MADEQVVIDASVALKWFHQEEGTISALRLQRRIIDGEVTSAIPNLLLYEAANATVRGYAQGQREVTAMFDILTSMPWDIVPLSRELLSDAAALAEENRRLSVYDAVYVALAIQQGAVLVTADNRLHRLIGAPITRLLHLTPP